jgi:hypothetical protein
MLKSGAKPLESPRNLERTRSIPTLASNSKLLFCNELQLPEEASASESASEIITGLELNNYSGITRLSLATTGFAARLV